MAAARGRTIGIGIAYASYEGGRRPISLLQVCGRGPLCIRGETLPEKGTGGFGLVESDVNRRLVILGWDAKGRPPGPALALLPAKGVDHSPALPLGSGDQASGLHELPELAHGDLV